MRRAATARRDPRRQALALLVPLGTVVGALGALGALGAAAGPPVPAGAQVGRPAAVTSVNPGQIAAGDPADTLEVVATGLVAPLKAHVSGAGVQVTGATVTSGGAAVQVSVSGGALPGPRNLQVVGADGTAACQSCVDVVRWSVEAPATLAGPSPSTLDGISCPAAGSCVAVGSAGDGDGDQVPLAEDWDGSNWSAAPVPVPSGSTWASLLGVSCASPTSCTAVGVTDAEPALYVAFGASWDGTSWSPAAVPSPAGRPDTVLASVSCATTAWCMAVGYYDNAGRPVPLAETWNGASWVIDHIPAGAAGDADSLAGVSCPATDSCVAVGSAAGTGSEATPLVLGWNGRKWSYQAAPGAPGSTASVLSAVSCPTAAWCAAVGDSASGSTDTPLAESWNGTSWAVLGAPAPTGAESSALQGLSCVTTSSCTAVGFGQDPSGKYATLGESWDGSTWTAQHTPYVVARSGSVLYADSCATTVACGAVGVALSAPADPAALILGRQG